MSTEPDRTRPTRRVADPDRDLPGRQGDEPTDAETTPSLPMEVPEADALEQRTPLGAAPWMPPRSSDIEAPEADVLEQAAEVPSDADDEYEHTLDAEDEPEMEEPGDQR